MQNRMTIDFVGTAAWKVPKLLQERFGIKGTHLERYAQTLNAVEINSSFYRDHQEKTFAKWSACVPENFRFSVKLAKRFTHLQNLSVDANDVETVLRGYQALGEKLGLILVQLPPSLAFDREQAVVFFEILRTHYKGHIVLEPRHVSWNSPDAREVIRNFSLSRAIVDPDRFPPEIVQKHGIAYFRLHGSPEIYRSRYEEDALRFWAGEIAKKKLEGLPIWCIFDNTTFDHATTNALEMQELLKLESVPGQIENRSQSYFKRYD